MPPYRLQFQDKILEVEEAKRGGIRWAVGSPEGLRSSTWRLWGTKKGDVYVSTQNLGGVYKFSFHPDGNCHLGFTSEYKDTARVRFPHFTNRLWEKWKLSDKPISRALQVVVPCSELRAFSSSDEQQMRWLPAPPPDSVSVVSIFITNKLGGEPWPGANLGAKPLGVVATGNRVTWAIHANNPIDDITKVWIEQHRKKVSGMPGAANAPHGPGIRVTLWGFRENQTKADPYCIELAWD